MNLEGYKIKSTLAYKIFSTLKAVELSPHDLENVPPGLIVGFACIGGSRDFLHVKLQKFILGASRTLFDFDGWIDLLNIFEENRNRKIISQNTMVFCILNCSDILTIKKCSSD